MRDQGLVNYDLILFQLGSLSVIVLVCFVCILFLLVCRILFIFKSKGGSSQ